MAVFLYWQQNHRNRTQYSGRNSLVSSTSIFQRDFLLLRLALAGNSCLWLSLYIFSYNSTILIYSTGCKPRSIKFSPSSEYTIYICHQQHQCHTPSAYRYILQIHYKRQKYVTTLNPVGSKTPTNFRIVTWRC